MACQLRAHLTTTNPVAEFMLPVVAWSTFREAELVTPVSNHRSHTPHVARGFACSSDRGG
jgi:hypothetical protein